MDDTELRRYVADLALALRWFRQAREAAERGEMQARDHCCERALAIIERVERQVLERRKEAQA